MTTTPAVSRVIHMRNLPESTSLVWLIVTLPFRYCLQSEMNSFLACFGMPERIALMSEKRQALVQFADLDTAIVAVNYIKQNRPQLRGNSIYCSFSRHAEIQAQSKNKVLLIDFDFKDHHFYGEAMLTQINLDVVYSLCAQAGPVHKIILSYKPTSIFYYYFFFLAFYHFIKNNQLI